MVKQFYFKQFNLALVFYLYSFQISNNSIWPIDRILLGATTLGQSGPGSDGNEGVLCILQSSCITEASPSDCLVSDPRNLFGWSLLSAEMQLVYCTAPVNWTGYIFEL